MPIYNNLEQLFSLFTFFFMHLVLYIFYYFISVLVLLQLRSISLLVWRSFKSQQIMLLSRLLRHRHFFPLYVLIYYFIILRMSLCVLGVCSIKLLLLSLTNAIINARVQLKLEINTSQSIQACLIYMQIYIYFPLIYISL